MATEPDVHTVSPNGHGMPVDWQGVPDDAIRRMELAYQEIQRRDSQAEARAWRKDSVVRWLGCVIVALAGMLLWLVVDKQQVKAFVQTVQVTDEGKLVQIGVPQDLYTYTPAEGSYMEMVAQWVRFVRWRSSEGTMLRAQWAWAYRHTCGDALPFLKALEDTEKPFAASPKRVAIDVKSVTKGPAPGSYTVVWEEHTREQPSPSIKTQMWTGTFTTGRVTLTTMDDILDNRLGICVNGFDIGKTS